MSKTIQTAPGRHDALADAAVLAIEPHLRSIAPEIPAEVTAATARAT